MMLETLFLGALLLNGATRAFQADDLPSDVFEFGVARLMRSFRAREFTVERYTVALIERIEGFRELNAFITEVPFETMLENARHADALLEAGEPGELIGIPFVAKDNFNSVQYPTTSGTPALDGFHPLFVAPALRVFLEANTVFTGKANLQELAKGLTSENDFFGVVRNPYNLTRVPGGSSGGTGAALGARLSLIGLGSDTQGSGRIPAAFCGVTGFRPSHGRYDISGVMPLRQTFDTVSPMATNVEDIMLMDDFLCTTTRQCDAPPPRPVPTSLAGVRIGISRFHFFEGLEPEVARVTELSLEVLRRAGAVLVEVDIPRDIPDIYPTFPDPMATYELPREVSVYLALSGARVNYLELSEKIGDASIREFFFDALEDDALNVDEFFDIRENVQKNFRRLFESYFVDNDLDVMVYPTTPVAAIPIGSDEDLKSRVGDNISFASVALFAALSVPGVELTSAGLPVGIEFAAPFGSDEMVLSVGRYYDELRPRLPLPTSPSQPTSR